MTVNFSSFDIQENQNGRITKDNIVWITGASSGIGESMAVQVANEGGKVILSTNRIESKLQNSEDHLVVPLDFEKYGNFEELVKQVKNYFRIINYLFNKNGGKLQRSEVHIEINCCRLLQTQTNSYLLQFTDSSATVISIRINNMNIYCSSIIMVPKFILFDSNESDVNRK
mmetsp:Transcript_45267/g.50381  ORF Transcript_45267/g.50381 Transcript_45267/m.50381 type:complete len:171 (+) Transcript_45267:4661-5173(+)